MAGEFEKIREENGIIYADIITFKHGVKKVIDTRVKGYKKSKQPKFTGRSKKNDYAPSPRTISNNSKRGVYKNIKRTKKIEKTNKIIKTYLKNDKEAFNGLFTYTADLNNTKNENKEIVKTIYNNRETIETATTKEKKEELANKIYDDFLTDANTKKYSKTLLKHSMFSLPPNLKLDKSIQAEILQKVIIETIDEMEEFKGHKYYLNIHEDQRSSNGEDQRKGGVHCHIVMAMHNGKGHSLHTKTRTELQQRDMKFKQKMTYNLYQQGIELDSPEKPPFTPNLHKELTFLEITKDKRVLVVDKLGEIRELKFKGAKDKAIELNLKLGDKFDYITEKEPKLDKDGNQIYINDKPQYKTIYSLGNVITQEQIIENLPENKLAREIEADKKKISWLDKKLNTPYKAKIEAEIENKELALKAIKLNDAIKDLTTNEIAITLYSNNPYISSDEKKKIIEQAPFIKNIDDFGRNYSKIAQYLPDEVKENIEKYIIDPYNEMREHIYKNPYLREERISKSNKKEELQKTLIEFCPEMTKYNKELRQLQEKRARNYQDIQRQWQHSNTDQVKSMDKLSEIEENKPTIPTPNKNIRKRPKDKEKER